MFFSLTILVPDPTLPSGRPSGFSSLTQAEPRQMDGHQVTQCPSSGSTLSHGPSGSARLSAGSRLGHLLRDGPDCLEAPTSISLRTQPPRDTPGSRAHTGSALSIPRCLSSSNLSSPTRFCVFVCGGGGGGWGVGLGNFLSLQMSSRH